MDLPLLTWKDQDPVRPVARALFSADAEETTGTAPVISKSRRPCKTSAPTPIVDTSVRRCTRISVQWDGFKPTFQELSLRPKRKKPRARPFTAEMPDDPTHEEIPPATPVSCLQEIGREMEIDATLLSVDATPTNCCCH